MITVSNLTYTYPGSDKAAVQGVDFRIEKGEIFGFLGPSGAGKSTTQKILIKLLRGYAGEISVFDKPLSGWDDSYYERVGVAFELPNHYRKLTGLENLNLFRSFYSGPTLDPMQLMEMVGLKEDANLRVGNYSKGMQMRLNFVRALLHQPELLFLDEPTTGLDPVNGRNVKDIIRAQKSAGHTVFLTTHDMYVADDLCDRVAFIVDGKIAIIDSPRNLKLRYGKRNVRVEYHTDAGTLAQADFPIDGLGDNADFSALLRREQIETIHTQEATLEDIFVETTGRRLA